MVYHSHGHSWATLYHRHLSNIPRVSRMAYPNNSVTPQRASVSREPERVATSALISSSTQGKPACARAAEWLDQSPGDSRDSPAETHPASLSLKTFQPAQASSNVPSTAKCLSEVHPFPRACRPLAENRTPIPVALVGRSVERQIANFIERSRSTEHSCICQSSLHPKRR